MAYIVKVVSRDTSPADHWKYGYMMERYIMCSHWMICDSSYQSNMVYLMDLCLEISFKLLRSRSYIYSIFLYLDIHVSIFFFSFFTWTFMCLTFFIAPCLHIIRNLRRIHKMMNGVLILKDQLLDRICETNMDLG